MEDTSFSGNTTSIAVRKDDKMMIQDVGAQCVLVMVRVGFHLDLIAILTLTLNTEFSRGGDVLGRNHKRVGSSIFSANILHQQLVNQFVDYNMDTVRGGDGLAVLHPGSFNVLLGEPNLQLSDVTLTHCEVGQRLHQGHRAH